MALDSPIIDYGRTRIQAAEFLINGVPIGGGGGPVTAAEVTTAVAEGGFGDQETFNETLWGQVAGFSTGEGITILYDGGASTLDAIIADIDARLTTLEP